MDSPNDRAQSIVERARNCPVSDQAVFLNGACGQDLALRAEVERLLAGEEQTLAATANESSEQAPTSNAPRPVLGDVAPLTEEAGSTIGRYRLLEKIGEGGFGAVWAAEQKEPVKRRVALKIIKLGMDTKQVVARFEAERQALALMDHPNIAKVLDAGATDKGRPYFVMELVKGIQITRYCEQERLTIPDRLVLFIKVCQAIQHAHQKGIIHRDIKPSNVLVTLHDGVPVPKVIDFGIAKATQQELTEKTLYTKLQHFVGTPVYMSPEQAEMSGLGIDTRSDIYSLGVVLYELLTGKTPFDAKELLASGLEEVRKIIREREPQRPSTKVAALRGEELTTTAQRRGFDAPKLIHVLKGDLDWIAVKCLEKDRTRRYSSSAELAMDVERHLTCQPVIARPPTATYRLQKAWQRNKIGYAAGLGIAVALLAGIGVSLWQARVATNARGVARTERDNAKAALRLVEEAKLRADEEARLARRSSYVSDLNLAAKAWEDGNLSRARELLAKHRPDPGQSDLRGFEWRLLWTLAHEDKTKFRFNTGTNTVTCVAVSSQGRYLAWGGADGPIRIVDLQSGRVRTGLRGHMDLITSLAFSGDGQSLASGSDRGTVEIWNVDSWTFRASFAGHTNRVNRLAFHPKDAVLQSTGADDTIRIWDLKPLGESKVFKSPQAGQKLCVSPDGRILAAYGGLNNTVRFWRLQPDFRELPALPTQKGVILSVAFDQDAKTVFVSTHDSVVTRWEFASLSPMETYWQRVLAKRLALSADSTVLATAGNDNLIRIWDVDSGREIHALRGHTASISQLALSADGETLVSVEEDHEVKVWATDPAADRSVLLHEGIIVYLTVSPDGESLAVSDPAFGSLRLWDLRTMESIQLVKDDKAEAAFSPDGKWLALRYYISRTVELWERKDRSYHKKQSMPGANSGGYQLRFSPDSRILVFRGPDNVVTLWDVAAAKPLAQLPDHRSWACGTAFDREGKRLATASDETIRIWDVDSLQLLTSVECDGDTRSLCFTPNGTTLIAASGNGEVRRWDVQDPERPRVLTPMRGHTAAIPQLAVSPDGKTLATVSHDSALKLWDVTDGMVLATLRGHRAVGHCLAWAPDGQTIFTGGGDATVRIWRASSWEEIAAAEHALDQ